MSNSLKLLSCQQIYVGEGAGVANLLSDTYEVIFGFDLDEPLASQLDDTLMHQLRLQFEAAELIITSVNIYQHSAHYLRHSIWR